MLLCQRCTVTHTSDLQSIHLIRMYKTDLCTTTNCSCFKNVLFTRLLSAVIYMTFKRLTMTYLTYDINNTQRLLHYILPSGLLWWRLNGQINQHNRIYATLCQPQQNPYIREINKGVLANIKAYKYFKSVTLRYSYDYSVSGLSIATDSKRNAAFREQIFSFAATVALIVKINTRYSWVAIHSRCCTKC